MLKNIYIIHIGKCGGASLKTSLRENDIKFKGCHLQKPIINPQFQYIILLRDPINRFISSFNWKKYRTVDLKLDSRPNEVPGFKYWNDVNNLAENIYDNNGNINNKAVSFIKNDCNQLEYDINWYLEDVIKIVNKVKCKVFRFEHFDEDIMKLFKIKNNNYIHVYKKPEVKLSEKAVANLKKFLVNDYACFKKLFDKGIITKEYYNNIISLKYVS